MTEQEVKDKLMHVRRARLFFRQLKREADALVEESSGLKGVSYDGVKVSGGHTSDLSDAVIAIEARRRKLDETITTQYAYLLQCEIEAKELIRLVQDEGQAAVLQARYINAMSWKEICEDMHWSISWAKEMHNRGIIQIAGNKGQ